MISPTSEPSGAARNIFWRMAIPVFFLTCFLEVSRILDPLGRHFRLIAVLLVLLAVSLIAGRRALVFWKTGAGRALPFLAAWIMLTYFMTQHSEGSFLYILNVLQGSLLFLAATGLLTTVAGFQKFFKVLACAGLGACALGFVWSGIRLGRFALLDGPYHDPNDYAMFLLMSAPIIWVSFARTPLWIRLCGTLCTALPVLLAMRTASRSGLVAMLAMFVVLFFLASIKVRILLASLCAVAIVVTLAFLPASLRSRLASAARIVSSSDASPQTGEESHLAADDSAVARQTLFMTSVNLTLENPVFGVGPGNFASTIVEYGKSQGVEWAPLNTYTQISSETGIPGFLLFGLFIFFSLRSAVSTLRRTSPKSADPDPEIHRMAAGLLVSLAAMLTCMFFLSEGYNLVVFLWLGLACGLRLLLPDPPPDEEEELIEMEPGQLASEP